MQGGYAFAVQHWVINHSWQHSSLVLRWNNVQAHGEVRAFVTSFPWTMPLQIIAEHGILSKKDTEQQ